MREVPGAREYKFHHRFWQWIAATGRGNLSEEEWQEVMTSDEEYDYTTGYMSPAVFSPASEGDDYQPEP